MAQRSALVLLTLAALAGCAGAPPPKEPDLVADPPAGSERQLQNAEADQELQRARGFVEAGKFEEARAHVVLALQKDPKGGEAHFYLGVLEEQAGKRDLAEAAYRKAIQLSPKLGEPYLNLAAILLDEPPRAAEALSLLEKALASGFDSAAVHQNMGFARALQKDWTGAATAYDKALAKSKGEPSVALAYGQVLLQAGEKEKAKKVLLAGLEKAPEDAPMLATYARFLGPARAYPECVKALDRALKLTPPDAELLVRRGTCKHELPDEAGAQADFEAALKVSPKFAAGHYYLAMSLLAQKKRERGLKELERAVELGAGTEIGARAQTKLDDLTKKKK